MAEHYLRPLDRTSPDRRKTDSSMIAALAFGHAPLRGDASEKNMISSKMK